MLVERNRSTLSGQCPKGPSSLLDRPDSPSYIQSCDFCCFPCHIAVKDKSKSRQPKNLRPEMKITVRRGVQGGFPPAQSHQAPRRAIYTRPAAGGFFRKKSPGNTNFFENYQSENDFFFLLFCVSTAACKLNARFFPAVCTFFPAGQTDLKQTACGSHCLKMELTDVTLRATLAMYFANVDLLLVLLTRDLNIS